MWVEAPAAALLQCRVVHLWPAQLAADGHHCFAHPRVLCLTTGRSLLKKSIVELCEDNKRDRFRFYDAYSHRFGQRNMVFRISLNSSRGIADRCTQRSGV